MRMSDAKISISNAEGDREDDIRNPNPTFRVDSGHTPNTGGDLIRRTEPDG